MNKRKGFTLIELLAVIVILGLLMAIAIPSVTKYITESRKKTVTSTIGNYITAMVNEVNDLTYTFTGENTIYAVPIECIPLERGGTSPFGEWHQSNDAYFAYVLVQYDDETSSYKYGYTFKDSAGYGLYPTTQANLDESGKQIKTGLSISQPINGNIENVANLGIWKKSGFEVNASTQLKVLVAETEGNVGDGQNTCTLCQKGNNYTKVEEVKESTLVGVIKKNNNIITEAPTLNNTSVDSKDPSGLYSSTATNDGNPTYYFRGNVTNNNIKFGGQNWKIVRINEDGTIRIVLNNVISNNSNQTTQKNKNYLDMYYSNSAMIKPLVDNWYKENIIDKGLDKYVATTMFCEQAKVKASTSFTGGNAMMNVYSNYTPTFKCTNDKNGKGIFNSKVGLITYDEILFAGGYPYKTNKNYYLSNGSYFWTMTPAGFDSSVSLGWLFYDGGQVHDYYIYFTGSIRPVINLNSNVTIKGTGTTSDPYVIQTN